MKFETQNAFRRVATALAAAVITGATFGAINSAVARPLPSDVAVATAPASHAHKADWALARALLAGVPRSVAERRAGHEWPE